MHYLLSCCLFFQIFFHKTPVNCLIFLNHRPVSKMLLIKDTEYCKFIPEEIGLNLKYYKIKIFCWHLKKKWFWVVRRGTTSSWSSGSLTTTKNETLNCWTPHGIARYSSERQQDENDPDELYYYCDFCVKFKSPKKSLQWVYWWNRVQSVSGEVLVKNFRVFFR